MARKISLVYTLALLATLYTALIAPVDASSNNMAAHARMIRKRVAVDDNAFPTPSIAPIGVGNDPNAPADNDPSNPAGGANPTPTVSQSSASASPSNSATPTASNILGIPIFGSGLIPTPSASSSNSSLSSTSSQPSSSSSVPPSSSAASTSFSTTTSGNSVVVDTVVATAPTTDNAVASPSNTSTSGAAGDNGGGHLTRNTIIAIVVVASCVGGAVVIWTVIRKWKFAPSDEFGDRLNPIDWRPTSSGDKEEKYGELDGTGAGHRRNGSRGSNRSFVSADAQHNNSNIGNHSNNIPDLPTHDFTAGAAGGGGLAPVGAYADLRRGPSPTPSMGEQQYYRGYGATQYGRSAY